jgi:hypothetical protein
MRRWTTVRPYTSTTQRSAIIFNKLRVCSACTAHTIERTNDDFLIEPLLSHADIIAAIIQHRPTLHQRPNVEIET